MKWSGNLVSFGRWVASYHGTIWYASNTETCNTHSPQRFHRSHESTQILSQNIQLLVKTEHGGEVCDNGYSWNSIDWYISWSSWKGSDASNGVRATQKCGHMCPIAAVHRMGVVLDSDSSRYLCGLGYTTEEHRRNERNHYATSAPGLTSRSLSLQLQEHIEGVDLIMTHTLVRKGFINGQWLSESHMYFSFSVSMASS